MIYLYQQKWKKSLVQLASTCLATLFFLARWKQKTVLTNYHLLKISAKSTWPLYQNAVTDLLQFLLPHHSKPALQLHRQSQASWARLKSEGGILLNAHFHNWELMGEWFVSQGLDMRPFAASLQNNLSQKIIFSLRKSRGYEAFSPPSFATASQHLLNKGTVAILWDQHNPKKNLFYNLNFTATHSYSTLPVLLAKKNSSQVFMSLLLPNGIVRIFDLGRINNMNSDQLICRYWKILSLAIILYPHFWYGFFHRIFKPSCSYK